jgi:hypothetical protein
VKFVESPHDEVRIRFRSNNFLLAKTGKISIGDYAIEQTPSSDNSEAILTFRVSKDIPDKDMFFNLTKLEANYFLSFLSLISLSNCEFQAGLWNLENIVTREIKYNLTRKPFNFDETREYYQRVCSLSDEDKRRFVNACKRYRQAISIFEKEPVVSFFLLVVAIECLSNSIVVLESDVPWDVYQSFYDPKFRNIKSKSLKFAEFVCRYLPPEVVKEEGDMGLLRKRLLSAYHIRNGFVHDGEDLPAPVTIADFLKRRSIAYAVKTKGGEREIRAPAMLWLEKIVVSTLKGYLARESGKNQPASVFREQAREAGIYKTKLRQPHPAIEKYQVMDSDFAKRFFEGDD